MTYLSRAFVFAVVAFLLSACADIPPMSFSVPNVGPTSHKIEAELKSITVTTARPDEKTGDLAFGVETLAPLWKTALEEALNRMAVFKDDMQRKVSLSVKILKLDLPAAGVSFTTKTDARYEVIDRATGGIVFTSDISSEGTTPGDYAFLGVARARESVNRSVQNNITQFLQSLETIDINKPMFPASSQPIRPSNNGKPTS